MYWITSKGIDYITDLIEKPPSKYTGEDARKMDILGCVENRGGGYTAGQILDFCERREIKSPLIGTRNQYLKTLQNLEIRI